MRTADLGKVVRFYADALNLHDGRRPPFNFPGNWLYAGDKPVIHLVGTEYDAPLGQPVPACGQLDHISFRSTGMQQQHERLRKQGVNFEEADVPSSPIQQIFVRDPARILVELTYDRRVEAPE